MITGQRVKAPEPLLKHYPSWQDRRSDLRRHGEFKIYLCCLTQKIIRTYLGTAALGCPAEQPSAIEADPTAEGRLSPRGS